MPEFKNQPRKLPLRRNFLNALLSTLRLAKTIILVRLAWVVQGRRALKRGCLVLVDRYHYNYQLDPASVKFVGPDWLLRLALRLLPQPDAVIRLRAPGEMLLQRKQELSPTEIEAQISRLEQLDFGDAEVLNVDASRPAEEVAQRSMDELTRLAAAR